ncbi:jerky protein homolog-like [Dendronephthya gigantea]|uniref:jerky protein homolog-like n=1 Tax=Dendronephthya gigantea TaxID=151771 RepID=UPI00106B9735|nr:jerky protein homolog-like [Dendronephthya gigantea]
MAESTTKHREATELKTELLQLMEAVQGDKSRKNRSFSMSFKREAISFAEETTNRCAAKKFKVDGKRIREWRQNKQLIIEACEKGIEKHRLKGAGRKVAHQAMEKELIRWYEQQRSVGVLVSRRIVMEKAKILYNEMCDDENKKGQFNASAGWLQKFQQRYGLSFREKKVNSPQPKSSTIANVSMVPEIDVQIHVISHE